MKNNKRICSIDLWKLVFVVMLAIGSLNAIVWQGREENLIFTGNNVIVFFIFLAGYFLMNTFKNSKSKDSNALESWKYAGKGFSRVYPAMLGGIIFAFVIRNIINNTPIKEIFSIFMNSIGEFLGISAILQLNLWNNPLWYLSAIIVGSLILYYVVSKSEDFFAGIFAPVLLIINYGFGFTNAFITVLAQMTIGMLIYYAVEYLRKKKFNEVMMMLFSFLHIGLAMYFVYTWFYGISWSEFSNNIIILLFVIVLLTNKDYIAVLYNKSKICEFLGKLSLYYYACHIVFIYLLTWMFPEMGYHASIVFNLLFTACWAFIMMYVDDYVITPIFRTNKKIAKKKTV